MYEYKKYDELDFNAFLLYADQVKTFDGKFYRIKGSRGQRLDNKDANNEPQLEFLSSIMYRAKTVSNDNYGVIAHRKKRYSPIKCTKNLFNLA